MEQFSGKLFNKILCKSSSIRKAFRNISIFRRKPIQEVSPYIILKATRDDRDSILELMKMFYGEEPTSFALGITDNPMLIEYTVRALTEGLSILAKCKYNGNIVGLTINESTNPWDADMKEKLACTVQCPKLKQLLLFYSHVQREVDLWEYYSVQKIFEMCYLYIRPEHRHRGLAVRLLQESINLGVDCGYSVMRCDATSQYTARVCEKLKMYKIAEIPYCTYLGKNLQPVLRPPAPHDAVRIYIDLHPQLLDKRHK